MDRNRPVTEPVVRGRPSRQALYALLQERVDDLRERLGGLPPPGEAEGIWGDIWYQEAHNSTALEGNTLVLRQVEVLLREGRAVGDKPLAEYLEVQGYAAAARWVYQQAIDRGEWRGEGLLSLAEVRYVHQLAMAPVWDVAPHPQATAEEGPGGFRRHDIRAFPGGMRPPPWPEVPSRLSDWLMRADALPADDRPFPEALADVHASFERIHPFLDGNGRTGRLLTNLILIRLGYPPAIIRKRARARYLQALQRADRGEVGPLAELLARSILATLDRFIAPAVAGPIRLLPLPALADGELSTAALRTAAVRGRLTVSRGDRGEFLSTRQWVEEYKRSRSPRGRRAGPRRETAGWPPTYLSPALAVEHSVERPAAAFEGR